MAVAPIVTFVLIALLAGSVGGVLVYKQIEYGTPPDWQTEIISRFTVTGVSSIIISSQQFEYQGNSKITDLYGSGGTNDVGMWSLMVDATATGSIKLEHARLLTLAIGSYPGEYQVIGSIELPSGGFFFYYDSVSISSQDTVNMLLTINQNYGLVTHYAK